MNNRNPLVIICMAMLTIVDNAHAAVFVCRDHAGHATYTDLGCPPDADEVNPDTMRASEPATQFLEFAPLDRDEANRLRQLEKRLQANASEQRRRQLAARNEVARGRAAKQQQCTAAKQALRQLQEQRRKGYRLKDAAALDEKDAALRRERAAACR